MRAIPLDEILHDRTGLEETGLSVLDRWDLAHWTDSKVAGASLRSDPTVFPRRRELHRD